MSTDQNVRNRHGSAVVTTPSDTEILITRVFDATAARIFEAWTTPALVKRWWGFDTFAWRVCDIDLQVGGRWRYAIAHGDMEVAFHGEFREIDAPHRIVNTEVYEGFPGGAEAAEAAAALNIVTLDEVDGVTTMTSLIQHVLPEHRDAHLASGMESGMQVSYDQLEDLLRTSA